MTQNRPLAGSWNAGPGNWRTKDTMRQPNFRNTRSNARDQSVGISGKVELAKVSGSRLSRTMQPYADPMLTTRKSSKSKSRAKRRQRRSR